MKPGHQLFHRFRGLSSRLVTACIRKFFRPTRFAKYEVAPRLDAPAAERRILQKISSSREPSSAID
jgi:hypothetical protein